MTEYERRALSRAEEKKALGMAAGVGAAVGLGVAAVAWWVTRVFLARVPAGAPRAAREA